MEQNLKNLNFDLQDANVKIMKKNIDNVIKSHKSHKCNQCDYALGGSTYQWENFKAVF